LGKLIITVYIIIHPIKLHPAVEFPGRGGHIPGPVVQHHPEISFGRVIVDVVTGVVGDLFCREGAGVDSDLIDGAVEEILI